MNRIVIFEKNGEIVAQQERLSKAPSGNATQRKKQITNGWRPEWVKCGQPTLWAGNRTLGTVEQPEEIAVGVALARWAEGFAERDQQATELIRRLEEVQFCRESGLL
jgi:hypothetical protein